MFMKRMKEPGITILFDSSVEKEVRFNTSWLQYMVVKRLNYAGLDEFMEEYGDMEVWWLEHESTSRTNYIDWKLQEG
ncbi:hypothetical protein [Lactiplantibacillus plantarum]|uniref:hypothetical protein n=1 Tax=Lactiplantibacillus plantarum TaxID=1590 RepID=UPI001BACA2EA|nr:hypothetical protein [Lactiplantibacillus plantarum]MBS0956687.1 hypothetical protein [Lactiplantibacillus plantarum]